MPTIRKSFCAAVLFLCSAALLSWQAFAMKRTDRGQDRVNITAMAGPSAFSVAGLSNLEYNVEILKAPSDAIARLLNNETDLAILPSYLCFTLLQKDLNIKILAVTGEGNLSVIGSKDFSTLEKLNVPSKGSTVDFISSFLYNWLEKDYSYQSPAQLAAMLVEGKVEAGVLPEPYASMVLEKNASLKVLRNVQDDFKIRTSQSIYPISILVIRGDLLQKKNVKKILSDFLHSYDFVKNNMEAGAEKIAQFGFIDKNTALKTIDKSGICFIYADEMKSACQKLYEIVKEQNKEVFAKDNLNNFFYF